MISILENRKIDINGERHDCVYIENHKSKGPRGYYYEWCAVIDDGNLAWGEEQGNYAGGTSVWKDMEKHELYTNTGITYKQCNENKLKYAKEKYPDYYNKIIEIWNKNTKL